jgi:hypothetical protein
VLLSSLAAGCGAATTGLGADGRPIIPPRDTRILHEDCPVSSGDAVGEDVNGDGRADRTTVSEGQRPSCRSLDFNFDGTVDAWVYLDETGNTRRRESDYDRDGRVDEVSLFRAGVLSEQHRATTLAGKLDTWHYYVSGKVARTERDSNGDDYVDQWWEYPAERVAECPLIHSDVDGDGRPDPGATVDVCRDQYVPASRDEVQAPTREEDGVGEVPTEVDTAPTGTPDPEAPGTPAPNSPAPNPPPGGGK